MFKNYYIVVNIGYLSVVCCLVGYKVFGFNGIVEDYEVGGSGFNFCYFFFYINFYGFDVFV